MCPFEYRNGLPSVNRPAGVLGGVLYSMLRNGVSLDEIEPESNFFHWQVLPVLSEWHRLPSFGVRRPSVRLGLSLFAIDATMLVTSKTTQARAEQVPGG